MYQFSYAEVAEDDAAECRARERQVLDRAVKLLGAAKEKGVGSRECVEALLFLRRLWTAFLNDLSSPENGLPEALRASLTSVGMWILREVQLIRMEKSSNFDGLIEMNAILRDGLN